MTVPDPRELREVMEELEQPRAYVPHGCWQGDSEVEREVFIRMAVEQIRQARLEQRVPKVLPFDGGIWTTEELQEIIERVGRG